MKIFNIGAPELIAILLLTLIVLGPQRIVETARKMGVWIRKLNRSPMWRDVVSTSNEIRDLPRKVMEEAGLNEAIAELNQTTELINREHWEIQKNIDDLELGSATSNQILPEIGEEKP